MIRKQEGIKQSTLHESNRTRLTYDRSLLKDLFGQQPVAFDTLNCPNSVVGIY